MGFYKHKFRSEILNLKQADSLIVILFLNLV